MSIKKLFPHPPPYSAQELQHSEPSPVPCGSPSPPSGHLPFPVPRHPFPDYIVPSDEEFDAMKPKILPSGGSPDHWKHEWSTSLASPIHGDLLERTTDCFGAGVSTVENFGICAAQAEKFSSGQYCKYLSTQNFYVYDILNDTPNTGWSLLPYDLRKTMFTLFLFSERGQSLDVNIMGTVSRYYLSKGVPEMAVPQGLTDVLAPITDAMVEMFKNISLSIGSVPARIRKLCADMSASLATTIGGLIFNSTESALWKMAESVLSEHFESFKFVFITFVNTLVRIIFGYNMEQLILEIFLGWFSVFGFENISLLAPMFSTFKSVVLRGKDYVLSNTNEEIMMDDFSDDIVPQSFVEGIPVALAAFMFGLSKAGHLPGAEISLLLNSLRTAQMLLPKDMSSLMATLPIVGAYFADDTKAQMEMTWPRTFEFMEINRTMNFGSEKKKPKAWQIRLYRIAYTRYLLERTHMPLPVLSYFRAFVAELKVAPWVKESCQPHRIQPFCFMFTGIPGVGKSEIIKMLVRAGYNHCMEKGYFPAGIDEEDCLYVKSPVTDHFDDYKGQMFFGFDDFLMEKQVAGKPGSPQLLLGVVNTAPYVAPMAALEDKGMYVDPCFVFASTNVKPANLISTVKNMNNPEALPRRFLMITVVPRKYDSAAGQMIPEEDAGADQWVFGLHEDRTHLDHVTTVTNIYGLKKIMLARLDQYFDRLNAPVSKTLNISSGGGGKELSPEKLKTMFPTYTNETKVDYVCPDDVVKSKLHKFFEGDLESLQECGKFDILTRRDEEDDRDLSEVLSKNFVYPDNYDELFEESREAQYLLSREEEKEEEEEEKIFVDGINPQMMSSKKTFFENARENLGNWFSEKQEAMKSFLPPIFDAEGNALSNGPTWSDQWGKCISECCPQNTPNTFSFQHKLRFRLSEFILSFRRSTSVGLKDLFAFSVSPSVCVSGCRCGGEAMLTCIACCSIAARNHAHMEETSFSIPPEEYQYWIPRFRTQEEAVQAYPILGDGEGTAFVIPVGKILTVAFLIAAAIGTYKGFPHVKNLVVSKFVNTVQTTERSLEDTFTDADLVKFGDTCYRRVAVKGLVAYVPSNCEDAGELLDGPEFVTSGKKFVYDYTNQWFVEDGIVPQSDAIERLRAKQRTIAQETNVETLFAGAELRMAEQNPSIMRSIVSVYVQTKKVGFGFMANNSLLLIPRHYNVVGGSVIGIGHGSRIRTFVNTPNLINFATFNHEMFDLMAVRLYSQEIPHARNHFPKFQFGTPSDAVVKRMSISGESTVTGVTMGLATMSYCGRHGMPIDGISGSDGDCGLPYVVVTNGTTSLLGIHCAGREDGLMRSYASPVTQHFLASVMEATGTISPIPCPAVSQSVADGETVCGVFDAELLAEAKVSINRNTKYMPVDGLCRNKSPLWKKAYGIAPLGFVKQNGEKMPVEKIRFLKWKRLLLKQVNHIPCQSPDAKKLLLSLFTSFKWDSKTLPTWNECLQRNAELGINAVNRGKSAGFEYPGLDKWIFFDPESQVPVLTAWAVNYLDDIEARMLRGEMPALIKGVALKDEKLPLQKVWDAKTRLFAPDSLVLYILSRRYFHNFMSFINAFGKNMGIAVAMNPFGMADFVVGDDDDTTETFGADGTGMEATHSYHTWVSLFNIMEATGTNHNAGGPKFKVDPNLPPLNPQSRIVWMLIRQMSHGWWQYLDKLFKLQGMLPSGCILTWVVNCYANLMVWAELIVYLKDECGFDPDQTPDYYMKVIRPIIFGDDSLWKVSKQWIKRIGIVRVTVALQHCADLLGYEFRVDLHKARTIFETPFCGRLIRPYNNTFVSALEIDRIIKMVMYTKRSAFIQNFPGQVSTFVREASYHHKSVYKELIENMQINGISLLKQLPALKKLKSVRMGFEDDSFDAKIRLATVRWLQQVALASVYCEQATPQSSRVDLGEIGEVSEEIDTHGEELTTISRAIEPESVSVASKRESYAEESFFKDSSNDYFNRPIQLATVLWTEAQARSAELVKFAMPSAYFSTDANPQMKLSQTVGLIAGVKVDIVSTSVPTQAGALMLTGSPMARLPADVFEASTGPHCIVKAGSHQTCSMFIPYVRDSNFSFSGAFSDAGQEEYFNYVTLKLQVLSPLVSAGLTSTVQLQIWISLISSCVMQGGLTSWAIIPQGLRDGLREAVTKTAGIADAAPCKLIATTAGAKDGLNSMSTVLMEQVGLSKPTCQNNMTFVKNQAGMFMANATAVDMSQAMCMDPDAKALPPPQLGGDTVPDPMDVAAICARESLLDHFVYDGVSSGVIWQTPVGIGLRSPKYTPTQGVPTAMAYCANLFALWRASIEFRLVLVKTGFHSGTLEVTVNFGYDQTAPSSDGQAARLHRVIWDITSEDEKIFHVPYVSNFHYRPFEWMRPGVASTWSPWFTIRAITGLITTSEVVADSIDVLVFVKAVNPVFQWPRLCSTEPGGEAVLVEPVVKKHGVYEEEAHPQSAGAFDQQPSPTVHIMAPGMNPHLIPEDELAARNVAGERVTSLRQTLKRFQPFGVAGFNDVVVDPFNEIPLSEYHLAVSRLFVFGTGGIRVKTAVNATVTETFVSMKGAHTAGEPLIISGPVGDITEITVPPIYPRAFYLLDFDALPQSRWPLLKVTRYTLNLVGYRKYLALADGATWSGINYLRPITQTANVEGEIEPAFLQIS